MPEIRSVQQRRSVFLCPDRQAFVDRADPLVGRHVGIAKRRIGGVVHFERGHCAAVPGRDGAVLGVHDERGWLAVQHEAVLIGVENDPGRAGGCHAGHGLGRRNGDDERMLAVVAFVVGSTL